MALTQKGMIGAVQKVLSTRVDYDPGRHTWSCFYLATCENIKFPYSIKAFRNQLMITDPKLVIPFNSKGKSLKMLKNCISGSFSYRKQPISILISKGITICNHSCHYWITDREGNSLPESVLWYNKNGTYGISQVAYDWQLPDRSNIIWAIGGAGMKLGDNLEEGFVGPYSDVFRRTSHMLIGFDQYDYFNAVEVSYMNKAQMIAHMEKLGIKIYILLDGGHVTASNVDGHKRNTKTPQYYSISLEG